MTRSFQFTVPGTYVDNNGTVFTVPNVYERRYSKSDVVKTEAHKLWLTDKSVWLPPTPYESSDYTWGYRSAILTAPETNQAWSGFINFFGRPGHYDYAPDMTGVYDEVLFKIRDRIKNQYVDLGAAFAEAGRSIDLIADSASRLARATKYARTGHWDKAISQLRNLDLRKVPWKNRKPKPLYKGMGDKAFKEWSDRWLELQFGWKPLLSDIDGAAQALAEMGSSNPPRLRFRATATSWRKYNYPTVHNIAYSGTLPWQDHVNIGDSRHGHRVVVWYAICDPSAVKAASLGLTNPLSVAWEVTPWSFVADWIYPVGKVLDTLNAYVGKFFIGGTTTEFYRVDAKRVNRIIRDIPQTHADTTCGYLHWRYMNRQVLTDFPAVPLPHVKNPLSVTHALDAIALLRQSVSGVSKWRY
jgi:hypothetical protein